MQVGHFLLGVIVGLSFFFIWHLRQKDEPRMGGPAFAPEKGREKAKDQEDTRGDSRLEEEILFEALPRLAQDVMPGIVCMDGKGSILWTSGGFKRFINRPEVQGYIWDIFPHQTALLKSLFNDKNTVQFFYKKRMLRVEKKPGGKEDSFLLFFDDTTDLMKACPQREEKPVLALIQMDNLAETLHGLDEENRPVLQGAIDKALTEWAVKGEGFLKKYAEDRYFLIMSQEALRECRRNRFDIMDRIREIDQGNRMPVTMSMGFGVGDEALIDLSRLAHQGLELALGRGGDQAVVKWPDKVLFYGGKSAVAEKKTKVRARVVASTLAHYIQQAENVIVMGHEKSDFDSAGASLGVARIALDLHRPVHVVLDNRGGTLDKLWDMIHHHGDFGATLVTGAEALALTNGKTLLVICDTSQPSLLINREILSRAGRIFLIDHHRRGEDFIDEAHFIYLETYASSTSELVTELLQYLGDDIALDPLTASALLAGIVVDTKHFAFQTGVRTFEAAGYLRRMGAEPGLVRKFFQDDLQVVVERSRVVQNARVVFENIVLGVIPEVLNNGILIAAEACDMLLNVENMKAAFVLYRVPEGVRISARSQGEINVQMILEELGGGGHLTGAGAQLNNKDLAETENQLLALLARYLAENGQ